MRFSVSKATLPSRQKSRSNILTIGVIVLMLVTSTGMTAAQAPRRSGPGHSLVHVLSRGSDIYGANGLFFGPDGYLYVASVVGREIVVYNPTSGQIVKRLGPDQGVDSPDDVTFGPDGSLYWTQFFTGEVGRMASDGTVTHQFIAPGVNPITMSDDGRLFVGLAFLGDALYELDPELVAAPQLIGRGYDLNGFDFGPDGYLYGPQLTTDSIVRVDIETGGIETVSTAVIGPSAAKFNSQGELHATEFIGGRVVKIDIDTGALEVLAEFPSGIDNLAFDSRDRLFISHATDAFVARVLQNGNVRYVQQPGMRSVGALAILADADGERLFEADGFALREIDPRSGRQFDADRTPLTLPSGVIDPLTVAPDGEDLLLTSWFSNQVQVWDPANDVGMEIYHDFNVPLNAVRFQGDLIVAEAGSGSVVRADGNDPSVRKPLITGLILPVGLAASDDDLWVGDWATGSIWQFVADGTVLAEPQLVIDDLVNPEGLTLDRDGALLVVESSIGRVTRVDPFTGATSTIANGLETGLEGIPGTVPSWLVSGIAVNTQGTIYVGGDKDNLIYRIERPHR